MPWARLRTWTSSGSTSKSLGSVQYGAQSHLFWMQDGDPSCGNTHTVSKVRIKRMSWIFLVTCMPYQHQKNWLLDACCVSCITRTIGTIGVLHLWHGVKYLEHIFHGWTLKAVSSSMHPPCTVWIACIPNKLWRFWDQPLPLLSSCGAPRSENKPFGHKMIQHATNLWQNLSFQQLLPKWLKYAQILIQMCPEISKKQLAPASKDSWIGAVGGLLGAVVGMLGML